MLSQVAALELEVQHLQDVQQDVAEHAVSPEALQKLEQQVSTPFSDRGLFHKSTGEASILWQSALCTVYGNLFKRSMKILERVDH